MSDLYAAVPEPPVNVRVRYLDGYEEAVDLEYGGVSERGTHRWYAIPVQPLHSALCSVAADVIPPHTTIVLRMSG